MKLFSKFQIKKAVAEFIGTLALVFFGCGAIALSLTQPDLEVSSAISLVFGLVITVMIYAVGHISGAHFNPAVTLAFACVKRFPLKEMPLYWLAQFLGAICGLAILVWILPNNPGYGVTVLNLSVLKGLFIEALLSFFLMFVIISVATDSRAVGIMAGAAIGLTVALDAFMGGGLTGASMNPARSLAPALFENRFENLWVYFVGPALGTCLAAFVYEWIRCEEPHEEDKAHAKGCC